MEDLIKRRKSDDAKVGGEIRIIVPREAVDMACLLLKTGLYGASIEEVFSELCLQSLRNSQTQSILSQIRP